MPRQESLHRDFLLGKRFTKNPEQKFERTGLIDPARGGTILLRFPVSRVVRNDQSTDEISSEEP
jgi:hypothetical protein